MTQSNVRVRFAPSPTGGLHLGGVRTALYNYLFAKKNNGTFVLRVEDTDQTRFVEGAEQYIFDCLAWCGISPDEGVHNDGGYGPYRQSERKAMYRQYAEKLVQDGYAYYAFDTPEELEKMRIDFKSTQNPSPQYDHHTRLKMRNSLSLSDSETKELINKGTPYVIRIKMPENETVQFADMIRGNIANESNLVDDKVLLKKDGMPTYHLAVVVDDYLMKITHIFRGEEWLPSAPIHVLLWRYLGWENEMPQYAHLPLILKPDGNGKLSKRDGDRLGFPVFAMDWTDPKTGEKATGFKERGFLPEAFINMLAMLGWNAGTEQEIFSLEELCNLFSLDRVHKGGAKFDFEKAKWFNHQHIIKTENNQLAILVMPFFENANIHPTMDVLVPVVGLIKERCTLLTDFVEQGGFFFKTPENIDLAAIQPKWNEQKKVFFNEWCEVLNTTEWHHDALEQRFNDLTLNQNLKKGEVMLPLRVMLVGGKFGPGVFDIILQIGKDETIKRIQQGLSKL